MNYTLNQVKAQINQAINRVVPVSTQGGKAGQLVWVQIPGVGRIQCKCIADIKQGQAIALLSEQGNWWLAGEIANQEKTTTRYKEYRQTELTRIKKQEEDLSVFFVLQESLDNTIPTPSGYTQRNNISRIEKTYLFAVEWANCFGSVSFAYYNNNVLVEETIDLPLNVSGLTQVRSRTITAKDVIFYKADITITDFENSFLDSRPRNVGKPEIYFSSASQLQRLNLTELEYPVFLNSAFYCFEEKIFYAIVNQLDKDSIIGDTVVTEERNELLYKLNPKTLSQVKFAEIESITSQQFCGFSLENSCYFDGANALFLVDNHRFRGKAEKATINNLEEVRTELKAGNTATIEYTIYSLTNNGTSCTTTPIKSGEKKVKFSSQVVDTVEQFNLTIFPYLYV